MSSEAAGSKSNLSVKALPGAALCLLLLLASGPLHALKSDRQEPLDVKADATDGTLGDGLATLKGNVEINQGTLMISADVANVSKSEGRVTLIELTGNPVHLQQEIENEGLVTAEAARIEYEVASGLVIDTMRDYMKRFETGEEVEIPAAAVFIYVGYKPYTDFVKGLVELDDYGYIVTDKHMRTSMPGIFAAGDVVSENLAQVAVAVGDGAKAAVAIREYLQNL